MISTGLPTLDLRLGGGIAPGRLVEIYGPVKSGRTALAFHIIKNAQPREVLYVNADHDFPEEWLGRIGVDADTLDVLHQPKTLVDIPSLVREYSLVVIDTITNLLGTHLDAVYNKTINSVADKFIPALALQARLHGTSVVLLNQVRNDLRGGNYYRTTGGSLLKQFLHRRIELHGGPILRDIDDNPIGRSIKYKVLKAPDLQPYDSQTLSLYYDTGINIYEDAIRMGLRLGLLVQVGSWIYIQSDYGTAVVGQGISGAVDSLRSDWSLFSSVLEDEILLHKIKVSSTKTCLSL